MAKFTQDEADTIARRFKQVCPDAECPLCKQKDFAVGLGVVPLPIQDFYPDIWARSTKGNHYPCAAIICKTCGNTFLLNLITLGLQELYEKPEVW